MLARSVTRNGLGLRFPGVRDSLYKAAAIRWESRRSRICRHNLHFPGIFKSLEKSARVEIINAAKFCNRMTDALAGLRTCTSGRQAQPPKGGQGRR